MSKVTFNNQNGKNLITLINNGAGIIIAPAIQVQLTGAIGDLVTNTPVPVAGLADGEIEVQNNNHTTVTNSIVHLSAITATSGTINLHNSYAGPQPTDITVGLNSTVNITGSDMCIGTLTLGLNSTFNFTHNNHNYHIQMPKEIDGIDNDATVKFQDIEKHLTICEFINDKLTNNSGFIAFDEICYLRDYQGLNHTFVNLLMEQNEMVGTDVINEYIGKNYFEFAGIARDNNLPGSDLEGAGPHNVMFEIASWLDLSGENGVDLHGVDLKDADDVDLNGDI